MKKILLIGADSFTARHLATYLAAEEWEIHGTLLHSALASRGMRSCSETDITDNRAVENLLSAVQPDYVINLAGWTIGSDSHMFYMVHGQGSLNLLLAARKLAIPPRILMIGTAAEYGPREKGQLPISEEEEPRPATHYGRSKLMQTMLCRQAAGEWGLPVIIVRPFNLLGAGMASHLAPAVFMNQIKQVKGGLTDRIRTGPLSAKRDYLDIRDAAKAYIMIVEKGLPGQVYNVCSGSSIAMHDLLRMMCSQAGLPDVPIVESGSGSQRSEAIDDSRGDNRKVMSLGWTPTYSLHEAVRQMILSELGE